MENLFISIDNLALLHPMVVHMPIAYVLTALLFELIRVFTGNERVKVFAEWMVFLGALGAVAAVGAGFLAAESLGHDSPGHDLVHVHRNIMVGMTAGLVLTALALAFVRGFRNGSLRKGLLPVLVILAGVMGFGADKGGELVYRYGTGVNPDLFKSAAPERTENVPCLPTRIVRDDHPVGPVKGDLGLTEEKKAPCPDAGKRDGHYADGHTH